MAVTNHERVGEALTAVRDGIKQDLVHAWESFYGPDWLAKVNAQDRPPASDPSADDLGFLLNGMWNTWGAIFAGRFGPAERNCVLELREELKRWRREETFSDDDTHWLLDTSKRLLAAFSATPQIAATALPGTDLPLEPATLTSPDTRRSASRPRRLAQSDAEPLPSQRARPERADVADRTTTPAGEHPVVTAGAPAGARGRRSAVSPAHRRVTLTDTAHGEPSSRSTPFEGHGRTPAGSSPSVPKGNAGQSNRRSWLPAWLAAGITERPVVWSLIVILVICQAVFIPLGFSLARRSATSPTTSAPPSTVPTTTVAAAATTTSVLATTTVPAGYAALAEAALDQRERAAALTERAGQTNSDWEQRLIRYAEARTLFAEVAVEAQALYAEAITHESPTALAEAYARSLEALVSLAEAANALVPGLDAPDDGSARRHAMDSMVTADDEHCRAVETLLALAGVDQAVPSPEYPADVQLITDLWRDYSDSWAGGLAGGFEFMATHRSQDCLAFTLSLRMADGDLVEVSVREDSIRRDHMFGTRGRVYTMTLEHVFNPLRGGTERVTTEGRVTIVGETAEFSIPCETANSGAWRP